MSIKILVERFAIMIKKFYKGKRMGNLYTQKVIVSRMEDIDRAVHEIINSDKEYFDLDIGELEPIIFKFTSGRFDDEYVPIDTLKIARIYKSNFIKYFEELSGKKIQDDVLYFNVKRNSFELDFQGLFDKIVEKGIGKMSGKQITLSLLVAIMAWASYQAYDRFLTNKEESSRDALLMEAIKTLKENKYLEAAKNTPPRKALEMIKEDEKLIYGNGYKYQEYTQNDIDTFQIPDETKIHYTPIIDEFYIKKVEDKNYKAEVTLKNSKYKTFEAVSKLDSNMPIFEAFDNNQTITLKLNMGIDHRGNIVEADIYEVIEHSK